MPKNVVCKKCNNLVNDWCEKVIDSPDPDMQRDCQYFCEKTNADQIRAMSDEELAGLVRGFISVIYMSEKCPLRTIECETCFFKEVCAGEYFGKEIDWLQQPAE